MCCFITVIFVSAYCWSADTNTLHTTPHRSALSKLLFAYKHASLKHFCVSVAKQFFISIFMDNFITIFILCWYNFDPSLFVLSTSIYRWIWATPKPNNEFSECIFVLQWLHIATRFHLLRLFSRTLTLASFYESYFSCSVYHSLDISVVISILSSQLWSGSAHTQTHNKITCATLASSWIRDGDDFTSSAILSLSFLNILLDFCFQFQL